eukprot:gene10495-11626_t
MATRLLLVPLLGPVLVLALLLVMLLSPLFLTFFLVPPGSDLSIFLEDARAVYSLLGEVAVSSLAFLAVALQAALEGLIYYLLLVLYALLRPLIQHLSFLCAQCLDSALYCSWLLPSLTWLLAAYASFFYPHHVKEVLQEVVTPLSAGVIEIWTTLKASLREVFREALQLQLVPSLLVFAVYLLHRELFPLH